jgi:hypothetical protein
MRLTPSTFFSPVKHTLNSRPPSCFLSNSKVSGFAIDSRVGVEWEIEHLKILIVTTEDKNWRKKHPEVGVKYRETKNRPA